MTGKKPLSNGWYVTWNWWPSSNMKVKEVPLVKYLINEFLFVYRNIQIYESCITCFQHLYLIQTHLLVIMLAILDSIRQVLSGESCYRMHMCPHMCKVVKCDKLHMQIKLLNTRFYYIIACWLILHGVEIWNIYSFKQVIQCCQYLHYVCVNQKL